VITFVPLTPSMFKQSLMTKLLMGGLNNEKYFLDISKGYLYKYP